MINERTFEKYTAYNVNYVTTASNGSNYVQVGEPLTKEEIENHTKQQDRIQYEKDLKEFTLSALNGILSSGKTEGNNLGHIAEMALNMAIVQMTAIKQHLTAKYDTTK